MLPENGVSPPSNEHQITGGARLAAALSEDCSRILINWSMRLATLPIVRAQPELALDDLQQEMPELLDAILHTLTLVPFEIEGAPLETASLLARSHGASRSVIFPIDAVLAEIQMLHREVRNAIWRHVEGLSADTIHEVAEHLSDVFDRVAQEAASGWLEETLQEYTLRDNGAAA
jgi:hypothetical protein